MSSKHAMSDTNERSAMNFVLVALDKVTRAVHRLAPVINYVALTALAALMLFVTINVFMRYVLNKPITGSVEITELLMVILVSFGFGYTTWKKGHVNVDLVVSRLPSRIQRIAENSGHIISIGILSFFSWQAILQAEILRSSHTITGSIPIPLWPFFYLLSFGCALMSLVLLMELLNSVADTLKKQWWEPWLWLICGGAVISAPWWLHLLPAGLSPPTTAAVLFVLLFAVLFSGLPIGIGMALLGILGSVYLIGINPLLGVLKTVPYRTVASETLSVVPMFVLMGEFAFRAGISSNLYSAARCWLGSLPGGLAIATTAGCAGFSSICGSSAATAVAMGTIALPEMKNYKYDSSLATGCVAAGGTLGILIPPSVGFIVYGLLTEQSIGKLFFAGVFPGFLLAGIFMVTIYFMARRNSVLGPPGPKTSLKEKIVSIKSVWPVLVIFVLVLGGFYLGVFTPTEAGAIGAFGVLFVALTLRRLTWRNFVGALIDTGKTTCMIFLILIGAMILGYLMSFTRLPFMLANYVSTLALPPLVILGGILIMYLFLGCVMESLSMIILTIPIIFPAVAALGFDLIWFGVIVVIIMEAGLITPPVGVNVFIIQGVAKDVPMYTIFRGITPFLMGMVICMVLLIAFPQIALFLPNLMK